MADERELSVDIRKSYAGGPEISAAFRLPLGPRSLVLFGPSGAGKTTILRAIAGLETLDAGFIACGGEVWFDGELIRKDGMFVPKDLKPLNPENLK